MFLSEAMVLLTMLQAPLLLQNPFLLQQPSL